MDTDIPDMRAILGSHDVVLITLDTLRYDVAQAQWRAGELPHLARHMDAGGWELRHTPASFTYAAHCAFFAGFLPTPAVPGTHPRLFCLRFPGSETTHAHSLVFDDADSIVQGFAQHGYHTLCLGGVGFFNPQTPLGRQLPGLFAESHWRPEFGVTARDSTENQVRLATSRLQSPELRERRVFLFINVSAIHQPNRHYLDGAESDNAVSHAAALRYVDAALAPLWTTLAQRGPAFVVICSDHGSAYGEDGWHGHRHAHASVMQVPYAQFRIATHD
jgi:hypothetical protein